MQELLLLPLLCTQWGLGVVVADLLTVRRVAWTILVVNGESNLGNSNGDDDDNDNAVVLVFVSVCFLLVWWRSRRLHAASS